MYSPENATLEKIVPPVQAFTGFGSAMLADHMGHLYMTEGFTTPSYPLAQAGTGWYRYDISTATLKILTPLTTGSGYLSLAPQQQGGLLLTCGQNDAELYQPT